MTSSLSIFSSICRRFGTVASFFFPHHFSTSSVGLLLWEVSLDLKKAFDTVNHQILLEKLKLYGVDAHAFLWFTSYLSDRKQCTYVNGSLSSCLPIICGVPQGSVLGPLLLLIYINDLKACPFSSSVTMYPDDTCFTAFGSDLETLQLRLNSDLKMVQTWLQANKLTSNVKKTKYLIIASNPRLNQLEHDFNIKVEDQ